MRIQIKSVLCVRKITKIMKQHFWDLKRVYLFKLIVKKSFIGDIIFQYLNQTLFAKLKI